MKKKTNKKKYLIWVISIIVLVLFGAVIWWYINKPNETLYFYYDNGNIKEERHLNIRGRMCGEYISYYENGQIKEETNHNAYGYPYGKYISYYDNGNIKSQGFNEEVRIDEGILIDSPEGEWIYFYENGNIEAQGNYKDGIQYGEWKYYTENGELNKTVVYENIYNKNGELLTEIMSSTLNDGSKTFEKGQYSYDDIENKNHFTSRVLLSGENEVMIEKIIWLGINNYSDTFYYENGQIKTEGMLNFSSRIGEWKYYTEDGQLEKIETYENGELINSEQF